MGVRGWEAEILHPMAYIRMRLLTYLLFRGMPKTLSTTDFFFLILFTVILLVIHAHIEVLTL